MQVRYLHRKINNLYRLVVPEKSKTEYEILCGESVMKWEECHRSGIPPPPRKDTEDSGDQ
jgi:hypothetical protein